MKRGYTLVEFIIIGMIVVILAAILLPVFARPDHRGIENRTQCQSNLKLVGLATLQYAHDYNDRYPQDSVARREFGWSTALRPYLKTYDVLRCPAALSSQPPPETCGSAYTDYWMNKRVLSAGTRDIPQPPLTLLFGDGSSPRRAIDELPSVWLTDRDSPLRRHVDGGNYAFADGHVKWIAATDVKSPLQVEYFRLDLPLVRK